MTEALQRPPDDWGTGGSGINPKNGSLRFVSLVKLLQGIYDALAPLVGVQTSGGSTNTQFGTVTLTNGTATVSTAKVTANSQIFFQTQTPGGTRTSFAQYVPSSVTPGSPGSFVVTAKAADGTTTISGATDVVSYVVIG